MTGSPLSRKPDTAVQCREVGVIQGKHHVAACWDKDSLWVEIAGPKGGSPWQMAPKIARALAHELNVAAARAEAME